MKTKSTIIKANESIDKSWLNADGTHKDENEIRKICKGWSPEIWELYLKDLETSCNEYLMPNFESIGEISNEEAIHLLFSLRETNEYPKFEIALRACLRALSPQQRQVIIKRYWENKSYSTIAMEMGLKRQSITEFHTRALKKLKQMLITGKIKSYIRFVESTFKNIEQR